MILGVKNFCVPYYLKLTVIEKKYTVRVIVIIIMVPLYYWFLTVKKIAKRVKCKKKPQCHTDVKDLYTGNTSYKRRKNGSKNRINMFIKIN